MEDPLEFKVCEENANQIIPLSMILPVLVPVDITGASVYTVEEETAGLIEEWCDHVAEIK